MTPRLFRARRAVPRLGIAPGDHVAMYVLPRVPVVLQRDAPLTVAQLEQLPCAGVLQELELPAYLKAPPGDATAYSRLKLVR